MRLYRFAVGIVPMLLLACDGTSPVAPEILLNTQSTLEECEEPPPPPEWPPPPPPPVLEGRMTGGGHQTRVDGVRITRGLTLHCDITLSNNLEINWPGGNKWHISKPLTSATCIDDPDYDPTPPAAPFDTFIGEAVGSLNGADGSIVRFTFIDDGEPGRTDEAHIEIWAAGDDPDTAAPVLSVSGVLDGGNLQAHYDQPHK